MSATVVRCEYCGNPIEKTVVEVRQIDYTYRGDRDTEHITFAAVYCSTEHAANELLA